MMILTGCPSPGGNDVNPSRDGGAVNPGNPGSPERTLSFTLELSEPNGNPLALGSGPSLTTVTSDAGTAAVGTVRGKTYPITVTQVSPNAAAFTLTVRKKGFLDTAIGPITIPPKGNPPSQTRTIPYAYTTTITGKVTTPAGKAVTQYDGALGRSVPSAEDAEVRASTDPAAKAAVAADGSFNLSVKHPGTFTLSVDYPAGRDYKAGAPQTVNTTAAAHTRDIPLRYGYTITLSGAVFYIPPGETVTFKNDATIIITVEYDVREVDGTLQVVNDGVEVARTTSSTIGGNEGRYRVTFDHPGTFRVMSSFDGRSDSFTPPRVTSPTRTHSPTL